MWWARDHPTPASPRNWLYWQFFHRVLPITGCWWHILCLCWAFCHKGNARAGAEPCVHILIWEGAGCSWSLAGATKQALHQAVLGHPALWGSADWRGVPRPRWHRGGSAGKGPEPRGTPRGQGEPWSHCPLKPTGLRDWVPCKTHPVFTKCGLLFDVLFVVFLLLFYIKKPATLELKKKKHHLRFCWSLLWALQTGERPSVCNPSGAC